MSLIEKVRAVNELFRVRRENSVRVNGLDSTGSVRKPKGQMLAKFTGRIKTGKYDQVSGDWEVVSLTLNPDT